MLVCCGVACVCEREREKAETTCSDHQIQCKEKLYLAPRRLVEKKIWVIRYVQLFKLSLALAKAKR